MSSTRRELLDIINVLSKTLNNINDEQFNNIITNSAKLVYVENEVKKKIETSSNNIVINNLVSNIKEFNSREETQKYIEDLKLKKDDLLEIGKLVNANISKKDTKQKITEKIVDATVGAKLRVEAISQIDLSRKKF